MAEPLEKPKFVTVRYIDEGEDEQEEAALRGIESGFAHLKTEQGQAELKAHRERENEKRKAEAEKQSGIIEPVDVDKKN